MIMPTLVRVRKNSLSSSNANNGAGILPFITPTSMIWRGSTCPSIVGGEAAVAARSLPVSEARPEVLSTYWKAYSLNPSGVMAVPVATQLIVHVGLAVVFAYPGGVGVGPSATAFEITTGAPTASPKGASVQAVTVNLEAAVVGQPGTVAPG